MKTEVKVARIRNIIGMAWDFTGMQRVFEKKSGPLVCNLLEKLLDEIEVDPSNFSHEKLCRQIQKKIKTTHGKEPSYGQAAKVVDIAMKVLVCYCRLPNERVAQIVAPKLHGAIDTVILKRIKKEYKVARGIFTISRIKKVVYAEIQSLLKEKANQKGCSPIEYDDWLWRKLKDDRAGLSDGEKDAPEDMRKTPHFGER
jgi:hypothetical protein